MIISISGLSFYRWFTNLPENYFYRFTSKLWLVKMVKWEMHGNNLFQNIFFSFHKKERIKISSNIRNFKNAIQHIPTVLVYHSLSIIYQKKLFKKSFLLFNIFPPLPFTGFTNFNGKYHLFYIFTGKFKTQ